MKLIIGLGNPGKQFERTPHNAGFIAISEIASALESKGAQRTEWKSSSKEKSVVSEVFLENKKVAVLAMPQTYMNLSGGAVQALMHAYGIKEPSDVLVIYDELDIALGGYKYSPVKNSPTHKGIASILMTVGKEVHSLRIGVEHRSNRLIPGEDYVTRPYSDSELQTLKTAISEAIAMHVYSFLGLL